MKWVLFVVLMNPDGSLDKVYNSASGWEDRIKCNEFVEFNHPKIIDSVNIYNNKSSYRMYIFIYTICPNDVMRNFLFKLRY